MDILFSTYNVSPSNSAAQNDTALTDMRNAVLSIQSANPLAKFRIIADTPGRYQYTINLWLLGINNVELDAWDAEFQNNNAGVSGEVWCLSLPTMFRDTTYPGGPGSQVTAPVYKFDTAVAGATDIVLTTQAEISNFSVGERIFLYGFDQQESGFPPNARYYEWRAITAIDVPSGTLSLESPLQWFYDDRWPEFLASSPAIGGGRILRLDRADYVYPERVVINGLTVVEGTSPDSIKIYLSARNVLLNSVIVDHPVPTEVESYDLVGCTVKTMEIDKNIGIFHAESCSFTQNVSQASGARRVLFENCVFNFEGTSVLDFAGRQLSLRNNTIFASPNSQFGVMALGRDFPTKEVSMIDNTINNRNASNDFVWSLYGRNALVVGAVGPGFAIRIDQTLASNRQTFRKIDYGTTLFATVTVDQGNQHIDSRNQGNVTDMYQDGTELVIEGNWQAIPLVGQIWYFSTFESNVDDRGNILIGEPGFVMTSREYIDRETG